MTRGAPLWRVVEELLREHSDIEATDFSQPESATVEFYPDVAERVTLAVAHDVCDRGILLRPTRRWRSLPPRRANTFWRENDGSDDCRRTAMFHAAEVNHVNRK